MKISIGVDQSNKELLREELLRLTTAVHRAVPGLGPLMKPDQKMDEMQLIILAASQIGDILISHANLEVAHAQQGAVIRELEETVAFLRDEYNALEKSAVRTETQLMTMTRKMTQAPSTHATEFNSAVALMKDYAFDFNSDSQGNQYVTFKESDLEGAFDDAMHSMNIKLMNS